jgi:hypothetical protein
LIFDQLDAFWPWEGTFSHVVLKPPVFKFLFKLTLFCLFFNVVIISSLDVGDQVDTVVELKDVFHETAEII